MRLLWATALLASYLICVEAAGYTCPSGRSKKVVTLKTGDTFDLETQSGDTYGKRVKCMVKFKRAKKNKCDLNFSCSSFALTAAKPTCKGKSDFFKINGKKYCKTTGPEVSTTKGVLNVLFKTKNKGGAGASCTATCVAKGATTAAPPVTTAAPPATTASLGTQLPPTGSTAAPVPNPGSGGGTFEIKITQSWSQETNYDRTGSIKVPATTAGQKLPLVVDLHGNGGQGNVNRLSYLGDDVVIAAPNGYERSWNINNEKSKADDVAFLLELIATVTAEHPAADANDVTIVGTSNGAAMIYRLLIATGLDRPFHRVLPMVSSLISVQWHDGQFWKAASGTAGTDFTVPVALEFSDTFEYAHFHGTNDGTIAYEGKSPGPGFLGANVDVIAAQRTDFLFAQAMGYTGEQLADSAGVTIGSDFVEYTYLGGRVKHFKEVGGTHGSTFGNALTKVEVKKMILGTA